MSIDNWLAERGVETYQYLGKPATDLQKDEGADETLKFLRSATDKDVGAFLRQTADQKQRLNKEQVLALADRPGFDLPGWIGAEAPAIMPDELGEVIADKYKEAADDDKKYWRGAAQFYASYMADSDRMPKFKKDLAHDPEMSAAIFSVAPQVFSDQEKQGLLHHAMDQATANPKEQLSTLFSQVRTGLRHDEKMRGGPAPWSPELRAMEAASGFLSEPAVTSDPEGDSERYVESFLKLRRQDSNVDNAKAVAKLEHLYGGKGVDYFFHKANLGHDAMMRLTRSLRGTPSEQVALKELASRLEGLDADKTVHNSLTKNMREAILTRSNDPALVESVAKSSPDKLHAAQLLDAPHLDLAKQLVKDHLSSPASEDGENSAYNDAVKLGHISRAFVREGRHDDIEEMYDSATPERKAAAAAGFARSAARGLDPTFHRYEKHKAAANKIWKSLIANGYPHALGGAEDFLEDAGEDVKHIDPKLYADVAGTIGAASYDLEGIPDEHLNALMNHRKFQENYKESARRVAAEVANRVPPAPIDFTPGSTRLRLLREHLAQQPDQRAHKKALEQAGFNPQALGLNPLLDSKGNLTHDAIHRHIESLPKRNVEYKIKQWDGMQRHSDATQKVFSVALPESDTKQMGDAFAHLQNNADQSSEGGHPTIPGRGIGWVRYTESPDGIHIDEIQSDFGPNFRAKAQQKYLPNSLKNFEHAYQQVWQGKRPNEVLHDAFLEHLRQQGKVGQQVHVWDVKPKMSLAGQDPTQAPPVHMKETYGTMPAKAGYTPSTYGNIQTQDNPELQGQPTWSHKLSKFENGLEFWFADRLSKSWRHQLLGAVAAGSLALAPTATDKNASQPAQAESQGNLVDAKTAGATGANGSTIAASVGKPNAKWTAEGLPEEMHPIAHLESSFGRNMNHAAHPGGEFQTAFGAMGLKPMTAHFEYMKRPSLRAMHPGLEDQQAFTQELKGNPRFYNQVASAHFSWLKSALGGDAGKAAYGWRWGIGAAQQASPEQIESDPYVQKYRSMRESSAQAKMHDVMDRMLRKHILPTVAVRMDGAKLQMLSGDNWETVAEKHSAGGWKLMSNPARSAKLLAHCLMNGEEIES